jgi:streptogramin lyase
VKAKSNQLKWSVSSLPSVVQSFFLILWFVAPLFAARTIGTFAGDGKQGFGGDGGPAVLAELHGPTGIVRGPDGALYICDTDNQVIRKVAPDGSISTAAGNGKRGYSGDGGPATKAELNEPYEVRFDKPGNLFFVERLNHVVRRVDVRTGVISTFAGTGKPGFSGDGGPATQATFKEPHSIQFGPDGSLYVCDVANNRVRRIDGSTGVVTTVAGNGQKKPTPDGAKFGGAPLSGPRALDFDSAGNLWVALREGNAVYRLDLDSGIAHHIAGTGKKGFTGDGGPALAATLSGPKGLSVAPDGSVYVADTENQCIRRIDVKAGTIDVVAGDGRKGDGPDGSSTQCKLSRPHGIFVDRLGDIYIGDTDPTRFASCGPSESRLQAIHSELCQLRLPSSR